MEHDFIWVDSAIKTIHNKVNTTDLVGIGIIFIHLNSNVTSPMLGISSATEQVDGL